MNERIGIIGLGYVGLPLACLFAEKYKVVGYDINNDRITHLQKGNDSSEMTSKEQLIEALTHNLKLTSKKDDLKDCTAFIVAVPTPIDRQYTPNLKPLINASALVGEVMQEGSVVIYESTVYPGLTEQVCVPILERTSHMKLEKQFQVGYSPERINPGDKEHTVENIKKITSGSSPQAANRVDALYRSVLKAGTFKASSIRVAEAAKIMENTQRDVNIAFMNEMKMLLDAMGVSCKDVIEAASTKWNFGHYTPGLVGGHCIGVDPYYLIEQGENYGYEAKLLKQARAINESMPRYVVNRALESAHCTGHERQVNMLLLGFTFKPNCKDIRNTKVADMYQEASQRCHSVTVFDPFVDAQKAQKEYNIPVLTKLDNLRPHHYDVIVIATAHKCFELLDMQSLLSDKGHIYNLQAPLSLRMEHNYERITNTINSLLFKQNITYENF